MIKKLLRKFVDIIDIDNYEIETDDGWKPISKICKTEKYEKWVLKLQNGLFLECADDHIIFNEETREVYVKDLIPNKSRVMTRYGTSLVKECFNTNKKIHMYDVQVDSDMHSYYSNDILSHNTTVASIYILHYILFNSDKTVGILANKEETASEILRRIKLAYLNLPYFLQQGIMDGGWNIKSLLLENGSKIVTGTTSSSSIRSKSISLLFVDEFAHIQEHLIKEFQESVFPTIYSRKTSQIILVSTPKGLNHFYDIYINSVKGKNSFYAMKVNWWDVPGRDNEFKQNIIDNFGSQHWSQEYAAEFLGSSTTLIDSDTLQRLIHKEPIHTKYGYLFKIYETPQEGQLYIIGADASKGIGQDWATVQVLKVTSEKDVEQVATYANNKIDPYGFAQVIIEISKLYNEAPILIENNGEGGQVIDAIWYQFEYDKVINYEKKGLGIRSSVKTKLAACLTLKRYIENGWIQINDKDTIRQLTFFEEKSENIFKATGSQNDDLVASLYWAVYFLQTNQYDGYGNTIEKIEDRFKLKKDDDEDEDDTAGICIFDE